MNAPALHLREVSKHYGGLRAVSDVTMRVSPGERRVLLGPNGAGKTTLFNVIAGAAPPTAGRIEIFGQDVSQQSAPRRARAGVARTFQTSRLLLGLSVADNLYLAVCGVSGRHFSPVRGDGDRRARIRAREAAEQVGITHRMSARAGDLSHGEQRQVEIALALAAHPRLILLDEPAAGLSRAERRMLVSLLSGLSREMTVVMIEHDMDVALAIAEQVTMMHDGRVVVEGTPDDIRANQVVRDLYLGRRS